MQDIKELTELLSYLKDNNIKIWVDDDYLEYDAPIGSLTDEILVLLKQYKSELISFLSKKKQSDIGISIKPTQKKEFYTISNAQRRLWVLDQIESNSLAYNIPGAFRLKGVFNKDAFEKSFDYIIERHESLRTTFKVEEGEPKQCITDTLSSGLTLIDLSASDHPEEEARAIGIKEVLTPFNLEQGPLLRFTIMKLSESDFILLFNMHHIISDGWSMNILARDFLLAYSRFCAGEEPVFEPLRIQYKDYSAWQNELLATGKLDNQKNYWLDKLSGEIPVLHLPSDRVRPSVQTFNGRSLNFDLGCDINKQLNNFCNNSEVSLFMLLQALVKALFYRYSHQDDIILGSPVAGRSHEDLKDQIGFYANTVVFRDSVSGESSFDSFLQEVKQTCLDAFENQDYPFDRLIDDLDLKRDMSRSPLFDVMLVLQNNENADISFEGADISPYEFDNPISKFDMTFEFSEVADNLNCNVEFNTDIYNEERILRLIEHFKTLVNSVLNHPESRLCDLEIVPDTERNLLLNMFNDTKADYPKEKTIIDLFEEQVEKTPDNTAVVFKDIELTYRELNEKANIVGHYLRDNYDIEPDDLVGVLLERSEKMIIALLGILKSGAAYVPIDPEYPEDRISYMLEDSSPKAVLSAKNGGLFVSLDEIFKNGESINNPKKINKPSSLAYVIYTSGSTGRPKGVLLENNNLIRLVTNSKFPFDFDSNDVWSVFHSFCFDFSVWEMYGAILYGGKAVIIPKEASKDPSEFVKLLKSNNVTILNQTPTSFYNISQYLSENRSDLSVRYVIFGGEALSPSNLRFWYDTYPNCKLINMYGITETTIHVTYKEITDVEISSNFSNIGKAIPTLSTYVLDSCYNLLPIGVPGEICVSGEGVCRGYLNLEELTNEKIITNPYNNSERMYLSGDSGYLNEDGEIIYLGRIDNQVQLRGFRIELGEIENAILKHDGIDTCAILAKVRGDDKFLVAYYVSTQEIEISELRSFLSQSLPDYMIPSYFLHLDELPLTANGKLDRKSLPNVDGTFGTGVEFAAPRNEIEGKLVEIWQDVLGIERIGINDNFFELGGHSIKALRLASKINSELNSNLRIKDFYLNPTISQLSLIIETGIKSEISSDLENGLSLIEEDKKKIEENDSLSKLLPDDYIDIFPLSKIQQGMVFFSLLNKDEPIYHDQFFYEINFDNFNLDIFRKAFCLISENQRILRTSFDILNFNKYYQIIHSRNRPELIQMEDISHLSHEEQKKHILKYIEHDQLLKFFNCDEFMWRMKIFYLGGIDYSILFSFHHAILDGWSVSKLTTELFSLYRELESGRFRDLKPLKNSYKEYVAINMSRILSDTYHSFWNEYLTDLSRTRLPFNYSRKPINNKKGSIIYRGFLSNDMLSCLGEVCLDFQCHLQELLLAAHILLLSIITGEDEIVTGVVSHDRPEIEDCEEILGCFLNTVPIRSNVKKNIDKKAYIKEISTNIRTVKAHEMFLADIATFTDNTGSEGNPLFDTIFNYTDFRDTQSSSSPTIFKEPNTGFDIQSNEMTNTLFDLETAISDNGINMQIKYSPSYFYPENIETAYNLYRRILELFINKNQHELDIRKIVNNNDSIQLNSSFNETLSPYPFNKTLSELFEDQVDRTPDNTALILGDDQITYKELNIRANRLASLLLKNNVKPGDLVAITSTRSFEMIIGMLGILKAGGGYVPIDPQYPDIRKNYIAENSGIKYIVQDKEYNLSCKKSFLINSSESDIYSTENHKVQKNPHDLAYIIYTSGSTGTPKGVMTENHSIINLINWVNNTFKINEKDKLLFVTSMCFDLSVYDIFGILSTGGSLVIASKDQIKNPSELLYLLKNEKVTFWDSVPSTLNYILDSFNETGTDYLQTDLRLVFMSGDWIPVNLPRKIAKYFPNAEQISLGGATEGTVWSNYYPIDLAKEYRNSIPYGRPIANNKFYILDENLNMVPDGVAGELYIGGVGVAQGYKNDPEKTRKSFVNDIFSDTDCLMYRTGDHGRMLPDGNMEFLGRIDNQVKIRGFRVELGEIENTLISHELIDSAVVIAKEDNNKNKYLVAYYVSTDELETSALRSFLAKTLPGYMIPSFFMHLNELPLTANGKLERKSLPDVDGSFSTGVEYIEPRTHIEEQIAEVWQNLLGIEKIGINDNFFELGGTSLKAVEASAMYFNKYINMIHVVQYPTIALLIENTMKTGQERPNFIKKHQDLIDIEYHYTSQGGEEHFSSHLDCNTLMEYFYFKIKFKKYLVNNRIDSIKNSYELFLKDFIFYVKENNDNTINDIAFFGYPVFNYFQYKMHKGKGFNKTIREIEKILDRDEQVMITTNRNKTPFDKFYDFNTTKISDKGHTFLILAHLGDEFFYCEKPTEVNRNYVFLKENISIGIIKKNDLKAAFEDFVDFGTINIKIKNIDNIESGLKKMINFSLKRAKSSKNRVHAGINGIDYLIKRCRSGNSDFNRVKNIKEKITLYQLLNGRSWLIGIRRHLMMLTLERYNEECNQSIKNELIKLLSYSYKLWIEFQEKLAKLYRDGNSKFNKDFIGELEKIRSVEIDIISNFEKLWS